MKKNYYSTTETAKVLKVSRKTVFQWARDGKIQATRVGKNYIIPHSAILEKLGKTLGKNRKIEIDRSISRALKQYEQTFKMLGKT